MSSLPFPPEILTTTVAPRLSKHVAQGGNLPAIVFQTNTLLAEIARRFQTMRPAVAEPTDPTERINFFIGQFAAFDNDEFLSAQTFEELNQIAEEFSGRIHYGYTELIALRDTVGRLLEGYDREMKRRKAADPVLAVQFPEDSQAATITYPPMVWTNLYLRHREADIITDINSRFGSDQPATNLPSAVILERAIKLLQTKIVVSKNIASEWSVVSLDYAKYDELESRALQLMWPRLKEIQQTNDASLDPELFKNLFSSLLTRRLESNWVMLNCYDLMRHYGQPGSLMAACTELLAILPTVTAVLNELPKWIKGVEVADTVKAAFLANCELVSLYITVREYQAVFARRVQFVNTLLYPNGTIEPTVFAEFEAQGGSALLLSQYLTVFRGKQELAKLAQGITLDEATQALASLKQRLAADATSSASEANYRLYLARRDVITEQLVGAIYPTQETKSGSNEDVLLDSDSSEPKAASVETVAECREFVQYHVEQLLRENLTTDTIFYRVFFLMDPWKKSFASVLYTKLGDSYLRSLSGTAQLTADKLTSMGVSAVAGMLLDLIKTVVVSD